MTKRRILGTTFLFLGVLLFGEQKLSILSLNVWSGLGKQGLFRVHSLESPGSRRFREELLIKEVRALDPDVLILQGVNPLPSRAEVLAESLDMTMTWRTVTAGVRIGPVGLPVNLREGLIILAKPHLSLEELGSETLSGGPGGNLFSLTGKEASGILGARILIEDRPLYLFSSTWTPGLRPEESNLTRWARDYSGEKLEKDAYLKRLNEALEAEEARKAEAEDSLEFVNHLSGAGPAILGGTFYGAPDSPELSILKTGGFRTGFRNSEKEYPTWDEESNLLIKRYSLFQEPGCRNSVQLDYQLLRGDELEVRNCRIIFHRPSYGSHPSSHYGILTEVIF